MIIAIALACTSACTQSSHADVPSPISEWLGRRIKHLWTIVAPVPNCWVSWSHLHAGGIVGMKEVERRRRIASVVADTESPIIVPGVQDEDKAIMNLGDKLVRLRGDQGKGLVWLRALQQPRKPLWVGPRSVHEIWKDLANWLDSNFLSKERCDPAWKAGLFGRDEPSQPRPVPAHRD